MQPLEPDAADVEVARGTGSDLLAAAAELDVLAAVRASTRDRVVDALDAALRAADPGPVAAVDAGADVADELGLRRVDADQWALTVRRVEVPADHCLVSRLVRGVAAMVPHAVRSPLVRAQGAVTLARRALDHGRHDELDGELERLATVTDEALTRADGQAAAIRALVADDEPPADAAATAAAGQVAPVTDPAALLDTLAQDFERGGVPGGDGGAAATAGTDHLGGGGPVVGVVVVPQLDAVPVWALRRLVAHLAGTATVAAVRVVLPGGARIWPPQPAVEPFAAPQTLAGDARVDLGCARAWLDGADEGVLAASAEVAALRRCGISAAVLSARCPSAPATGDDGPAVDGWAQLALPATRLAQIAAAAPGWPSLLRGGVEAVVFTRGDEPVGPAGEAPAADRPG